MTTPTMPVPEHILMAQGFLEEADDEFAVGKPLKGSEMLWGAVSHALVAIALLQHRPYNSHGALRNIATRIPNVRGRPAGKDEFARAEEFHINFYHGQLTDEQITDNRPEVKRFVERLLRVADSEANRS